MKALFERQSLTPLVVGTAFVLMTGVAHAERLNPAGDHQNARLSSEAAAQASSVKSSSAASARAPQTTVAQVKTWVKSKIRVIKSLFGEDAPPAPRAVAAKELPTQLPPAREVASGASGASGAPDAPPIAPSMPSASIEAKMRAPSASASDDRAFVDAPGMSRTSSGVASYSIESAPSIPLLKIEKEKSISVSDYKLDSKLQNLMDKKVVRQLDSPALMAAQDLKAMLAMKTPKVGAVQQVKLVTLPKKGKVSTQAVDHIVLKLAPERELSLKKFTPLTPEETRFLSGLLLLQKGDQCPTAIGLFYKLSKSKGWEAESNYYLAACSKQMKISTDFYVHAQRVLETQDPYYSKKILAELGNEIPYEVADGLGNALLKLVSNPKNLEGLSEQALADIAYVLADFSVTSERFKTALTWAPKVSPTHPKYLKAQFLMALAEYQAGSKANASKIQDMIVNDKKTDRSKMEFQALVALNAARIHFQERNFKEAHDNFLKVYKDHPLWLQSLTELGWSQLMDGDYEGAIGNMHSIQSPFFQAVYKPESYVIRTIGYLNLCQYGDAYRSLSTLERDYRPYLDKVSGYLGKPGPSLKSEVYQTVKNFMRAPKEAKEIDGLPAPIVREIARHRDYTNLQKALNRLIDERPLYTQMDGQVEKALKNAQANVTATRKRIEDLRKKLAASIKRRDEERSDELQSLLDSSFNKLNDQFFAVDLYSEAKSGMDAYREDIVGGADKRMVTMRGRIGQVLTNRLLQVKVDLARMLDNNELLRYEVFAGSGENIRFQVAGGDIGNRVPASVLPKSKSLHWEFEGEYWEDEIGHFRSSLKNNCPDAAKQVQAHNDGGES